MRFDELGLAEPIVRAVADAGYESPTPIQTKAIPPVMNGEDVLGCARTGTGKTGAFALPILHRLAAGLELRPTRTPGRRIRRGRGGVAAGDGLARGRAPRVLVLAPTRELATQIGESFAAYGRHLPLSHTTVFGGVSQHRQVKALERGVDVLVATPGRLLDLVGQRVCDLSQVEVLVLDEADHMLDMGFIPDVRRIVGHLPANAQGGRQTLLFSATMPKEIRRLADTVLRDPVEIRTAPVSSPATAIAQSVFHVERRNKAKLLERVLRGEAGGRTLVFSRTKHGADKLVRVLGKAGIDAVAIHGNKAQNARTRALDAFRSGRTTVLVATDIAARGIDVDGVTHVVNHDVPHVPETYVHRIGRTARAGASGSAITFCDPEEVADLRAIEQLTGRPIDVRTDEPDLLTPVRSGRPSPAKSGGSRSGGSRSGGSRPGGGRSGGSGGSGGSGATGGRGGKRTSRRRRGGGGGQGAASSRGAAKPKRTRSNATAAATAPSGGHRRSPAASAGGGDRRPARGGRVAQGGRVPARRR